MNELPSGPPRFSSENGIARITLQRPAHRNRLHNEDLLALSELLEQVDADKSIRVLVLDAEVLTERPVFCAGYHIGDFDAGPAPVPLEQVTQKLQQVRPVTICVLNGSVYGGGTDFPLACDIALGAEDIEARVPAAALGLHYHADGLLRYVSRIGLAATRRLLLTAESVDAQSLLRIGFVQELLPSDQLTQRVEALALRIAGLAPLALETVKKSLNEIASGEFDIEKLNARSHALKNSEDFAEARRAFAERRAPVWKGR